MYHSRQKLFGDSDLDAEAELHEQIAFQGIVFVVRVIVSNRFDRATSEWMLIAV